MKREWTAIASSAVGYEVTGQTAELFWVLVDELINGREKR